MDSDCNNQPNGMMQASSVIYDEFESFNVPFNKDNIDESLKSFNFLECFVPSSINPENDGFNVNSPQGFECPKAESDNEISDTGSFGLQILPKQISPNILSPIQNQTNSTARRDPKQLLPHREIHSTGENQSKQHIRETGPVKFNARSNNNAKEEAAYFGHSQTNQENIVEPLMIESISGLQFSRELCQTDNTPIKKIESYLKADKSGSELLMESMKVRESEKPKNSAKKSNKNKSSSEQEAPEYLEGLDNVTKISLKIPCLHYETDDFTYRLRTICKCLTKVSEVKVDFRGLQVNENLYDEVQPYVEKLLNIMFTSKIPLKSIEVYWNFKYSAEPDAGEYLLSYVSHQLQTKKDLNCVCISLEQTISDQVFSKFLESLDEDIQKKLLRFELTMHLDKPKPEIFQKPLVLPEVTYCTLKFTCLGDFSADLVKFVQKSLGSMKSVKGLVLEFFLNDFPVASIAPVLKEVIKCKKLKKLTIIFWPCKKPMESRPEFFKDVMRVAKDHLDYSKLTELNIGTDTTTFIRKLETQGKIKDYFKDMDPNDP